MFFSTLVALSLTGASLVAAQTVHTVTVGANGTLLYNPTNIQAAVGDKVAFEFRAKNHTATQSTFTNPCVPGTFNGSAGADSGFAFIPPNNTLQEGQFPVWTITVNSTAPLWFHCAQTTPKSHCEAGMVFSINATPEKSFDAFLANAKASTPPPAASSAPAAGDSTSSNSSDSSSSPSISTDPSTSGNSTSDATPLSSDPSSSNSTTDASANSTSVDPAAAPSINVAPPSAALTAGAPAAPVASGAANAGSSAEASNSNTTTTTTSGAASIVVSRGAAGLLAALTIGAVLL